MYSLVRILLILAVVALHCASATAEFIHKYPIAGNLAHMIGGNPGIYQSQLYGEMNGDAFPEILVFRDSHRTLDIISGLNGQRLYTYTTGGNPYTFVTLLDVDDDGLLDILAQKDGANCDVHGWAGPYAGSDEGAVLSRSTARLGASYPRPASENMSISFALETEGHVEIDIYDVSGRLVRSLVGGDLPSGQHVTAWDGRDNGGRRLASGNYYYRLVVDKMVIGTDKTLLIQ